MRGPTAAIPVIGVGATRAASMIWRWRGGCHVTVAVKATFAVEHRRVMSVVSADRVEDDELVPYRTATDVVVTSAHAFSDRPTEAMAARLAVVGTQTLVDKSLLVYAPRPGGVVAPFQKTAIVRSGRRPQALVVDPQRPNERATFGRVEGHLPTHGDGGDGSLVVDDDVRWEAFSVAQPDQRVRGFAGDEWVIVEGMHPRERRIESKLPGLLAEVRIYPPLLWSGRSLVLAMSPCLFALDMDAGRCSLVWRGGFTVDHFETAEQLTAVAVLHTPGRATTWPTTAEVAQSTALARRRQLIAAHADTKAANLPDLDADSALQAKVAARLQALGPAATMVVDVDTDEMSTSPDERPARCELADGVVTLSNREPSAGSASGTLDLPPDRAVLAPPGDQLGQLQPIAGAPWASSPAISQAARRAAGGTIIADEPSEPPPLAVANVDTLEDQLSETLDETAGDAIAQVFRERRKP